MAQYPILDQEPATQRWYQVNTPKFKVIYQEGNDSLAIGLARRLQSWYTPVAHSLKASPKKLSLVLRSQTTRSNGFVTLAPRRSEFFTMPPQDYNFAGANPWLDLLAIHEFRHVVQFEKSKTGFNKLLYYGFGEEALASMSFLAVPQWFWEGDAVATETALTPSGRGRMPEFDIAFRTNLLEKGAFNYNKQYLGSFKDFVPNYYITGYHLVTHLRRQYPTNPWDDILQEAFSKPYIPFTFSRAIRKKTGNSLVKTYNQMIAEVNSLWQEQRMALDTTSASIITASNKEYTNYMFPQTSSSEDVVALKSGMGDITQLVRIDAQGKEKTEVVTGFVANSGMLSAQKGLVVWNEFRPDLRWGARTSTVIKLYDLHTGKLHNVTGPSRYSAASLSPDTTRIATVYVGKDNTCYLTILDRYNGKELLRFPNEANDFIAMPRWSVDGNFIVALLVTAQGKTIIQADVKAGTIKKLLPLSFENLGNPLQYGDYVLFNAAYNGIDNIYALQLSTKEKFQVTSREYGAFAPALNTEKEILFFNDYQVNGMAVGKMPYTPETWIPLSAVKGKPTGYYEPLVDLEGNRNLYDGIDSIDYKVGRYRSLKHLFNMHSWGILWLESFESLALDIKSQSIQNVTELLGFESLVLGIKSQDILSTHALSAGYAYNPFESAGYAFGRASYQGFFPVIDLDIRVGNRSVEDQFIKEGETVKEDVKWHEEHIALGLRVPLDFTRSKYHQKLMLQGQAGITKVSDYNLSQRKYNQQANGLLKSLNYGFQYSRLLKVSKRDIYSRWGQVIKGGYEHAPFGGDYTGSKTFFNAQLFNPGLLKHHSFYIKASYQFQDMLANYRFSNSIPYPKGYGYTAFENFYLASFNYTLPLFYPDWSIGPLFYFQRVRGNAFHDRGWGTRPDIAKTFSLVSSGVELSVDFNFMRFLPLFNVGVRYAYLHETNNFNTQLIIGAIGF